MYTVLLYAILLTCVIIAFILADKRLFKEKAQRQKEHLEANLTKKEKFEESGKEKEEKI